MGLYQNPKFHIRSPETRVRVRTDDPAKIKQLLEAGYIEIPDDGVTLNAGAVGLSQEQVDALNAMGIRTPADLANTPDEELLKAEGVGQETVKALRKT